MIDAAAQILSTAKSASKPSSEGQRSSYQDDSTSKSSFSGYLDKSQSSTNERQLNKDNKQDQNVNPNLRQENKNTVSKPAEKQETTNNRIDDNKVDEGSMQSTQAKNKKPIAEDDLDKAKALEKKLSKKNVDENIAALLNITSDEDTSDLLKNYIKSESETIINTDESETNSVEVNNIAVLSNVNELSKISQTGIKALIDDLSDDETKIDGENKLKSNLSNKAKLIVEQIVKETAKNDMTDKTLKEINASQFGKIVVAPMVKPDMIVSKDFKIETDESFNNVDLELEETTETDFLLAKVIEKLDFSKNKAELMQQNVLAIEKSIMEKNSAVDIVEQLTQRTGQETSVERASLIQSTGGIQRASPSGSIQQFILNTPVNQSEWGNEFSRRIQFMVNSDIKSAELRLDPPELGRINIKISMNQDQASMVFNSAHSNVRDAIENALPKLRELLNEAGIQLTDADINSRQQQNTERNTENSSNSSIVERDENIGDMSNVGDISGNRSSVEIDGLIDYFA